MLWATKEGLALKEGRGWGSKRIKLAETVSVPRQRIERRVMVPIGFGVCLPTNNSFSFQGKRCEMTKKI